MMDDKSNKEVNDKPEEAADAAASENKIADEAAEDAVKKEEAAAGDAKAESKQETTKTDAGSGYRDIFCPYCGCKLDPDHNFCPQCGRPVRKDPAVQAEKPDKKVVKKAPLDPKKKKKVLLYGGIGLAVIAILVVAIVLYSLRVDRFAIRTTSVALKKGQSQTIAYDVEPKSVKPERIKWESSDPSVATVDDKGNVVGIGPGQCTITASVGGKSDTLDISIMSYKTLLKMAYTKFCLPQWASISGDGQSLTIKTVNVYGFYSEAAFEGLVSVISVLGLPSSLLDEMTTTRAIDGRQREQYEGITVSWSYYPDQGIMAVFAADY